MRHHYCGGLDVLERWLEMYHLKRMWHSPNSVIRNVLGGAFFREPISANGLPLIKQRRKPIVVARHAFGDQHLGRDFVSGPGSLDVRYMPDNGWPYSMRVCDFEDTGAVAEVMSITESTYKFALQLALRRNLPLYLNTKETILKKYDGRSKDTFELLCEKHKPRFKNVGVFFQHCLMDDMVARWLRVWARKNYEGDIQSGFVAQGFGSLDLMTNVLICPSSLTMSADVAHGTVTKHFRRYKAGGELAGGAKLLVDISGMIEKVVVEHVELRYMTKHIAMGAKGFDHVHSEDYMITLEFNSVAGQMTPVYKQVFMEEAM
ncbi:hypothetical protein MTO96_015611 [Rhipicephalus appendiculatus]